MHLSLMQFLRVLSKQFFKLVLIDKILWHLILFGFYSEDQSRLAARKYARVVQKLGFPVSSISLEQFSFEY